MARKREIGCHSQNKGNVNRHLLKIILIIDLHLSTRIKNHRGCIPSTLNIRVHKLPISAIIPNFNINFLKEEIPINVGLKILMLILEFIPQNTILRKILNLKGCSRILLSIDNHLLTKKINLLLEIILS